LGAETDARTSGPFVKHGPLLAVLSRRRTCPFCTAWGLEPPAGVSSSSGRWSRWARPAPSRPFSRRASCGDPFARLASLWSRS